MSAYEEMFTLQEREFIHAVKRYLRDEHVANVGLPANWMTSACRSCAGAGYVVYTGLLRDYLSPNFDIGKCLDTFLAGGYVYAAADDCSAAGARCSFKIKQPFVCLLLLDSIPDSVLMECHINLYLPQDMSVYERRVLTAIMRYQTDAGSQRIRFSVQEIIGYAVTHDEAEIKIGLRSLEQRGAIWAVNLRREDTERERVFEVSPDFWDWATKIVGSTERHTKYNDEVEAVYQRIKELVRTEKNPAVPLRMLFTEWSDLSLIDALHILEDRGDISRLDSCEIVCTRAGDTESDKPAQPNPAPDSIAFDLFNVRLSDEEVALAQNYFNAFMVCMLDGFAARYGKGKKGGE